MSQGRSHGKAGTETSERETASLSCTACQPGAGEWADPGGASAHPSLLTCVCTLRWEEGSRNQNADTRAPHHAPEGPRVSTTATHPAQRSPPSRAPPCSTRCREQPGRRQLLPRTEQDTSASASREPRERPGCSAVRHRNKLHPSFQVVKTLTFFANNKLNRKLDYFFQTIQTPCLII